MLLGNLHECQTKLPGLFMISLAFINREAQERKTVSKKLEATSALFPPSSSFFKSLPRNTNQHPQPCGQCETSGHYCTEHPKSVPRKGVRKNRLELGPCPATASLCDLEMECDSTGGQYKVAQRSLCPGQNYGPWGTGWAGLSL